MPPWGLALCEGETLLLAVTLCYVCSNAYVYTAEGRDLREFDPTAARAVEPRNVLRRHLPIAE